MDQESDVPYGFIIVVLAGIGLITATPFLYTLMFLSWIGG